jgi:hypothetical protein
MKILIAVVTLMASCSYLPQSQVSKPTPGRPKQLQLNVPKETWEPIFFRAIDERSKLGNLKPLRSGALPNGDLEIRVWRGFGLTPLAGFLLKRTSGQWSALHIAPTWSRTLDKSQSLSAPKSGWDTCWQRLETGGLLALPDASEIACDGGINDGVFYVVEYNRDAVYRTYMYDNPDRAKCDEAKRLIQTANIIAEEFSIPEMALK